MKHETGNWTHDFRRVCAEGDGREEKRQFKSNSPSFGLKRSGGGCCAADNSNKKKLRLLFYVPSLLKNIRPTREFMFVFFPGKSIFSSSRLFLFLASKLVVGVGCCLRLVLAGDVFFFFSFCNSRIYPPKLQLRDLLFLSLSSCPGDICQTVARGSDWDKNPKPPSDGGAGVHFREWRP